MKNKILILLLCFIFNIFSVSYASATASVTVGNADGVCGDTIEIPISLSGNTGFVSLGLEIDYDSSVLELTSVNENTSVGATFTKAQTLDAKPYNLGWSSATNVLYNGELATLTFKILTKVSGSYPVTVSYYKGRNGNYTDGFDVNYDENFDALNLNYVDGAVEVTVEKSVCMTVNVNGNSVTFNLPDEEITGLIAVAIYENEKKLTNVKMYAAEETVTASFDDIGNASFAKVMWWVRLDVMEPISESKIIRFE